MTTLKGTTLADERRVVWARIAAATLIVCAVTLASCEDLPGRGAEPRSDLLAVLHPDLEQSDPTARQTLIEARREVARLTRDRSTSDHDLAAAFGVQARHYHAYQLLEPAVSSYRNATTLEPGNPAWSYGLGLALEQRGDLEGAADSYGRALATKGAESAKSVETFDTNAARLRLANLKLDLGRTEEAVTLFRQVLDSAAAAYLAAAHFGLARCAIAHDDDRIAETELRQVLALSPQAGDARYTLAQLLRRAGSAQEALVLLEQGSQGEVSHPDPTLAAIQSLEVGAPALLSRANQSMMAGKLVEAEALFREALRAAPGNTAIYRNLAVTLRRLDRLEETISVLDQGLEIDPHDANLRSDLAAAYLASGSGERAVEHYRQALATAGDSTASRFGLANALVSLGRWQEAEVELERIVELEPENRRARYQLVMSRYQQDPGERGTNQVRLLVEELPEFSPARLSLASILLQSNDVDGAREQFRWVLETSDEPQERATAHTQMGQIALQRGEIDTAVSEFESVLAIDGSPASSSTKVMHALARILATATDPSVRDGVRALELARTAYLAEKSIDRAETLAMAMAASGDLEGAMNWQQGLVDQARSIGRSDLVERLEVHLHTYQAGRLVEVDTQRSPESPG